MWDDRGIVVAAQSSNRFMRFISLIQRAMMSARHCEAKRTYVIDKLRIQANMLYMLVIVKMYYIIY